MPKVLVTRPREDAEEVCDALRLRGFEPILAPMMEIRIESGVALSLDDVQAILLTSANGARALAAATERRDIPVLTVGEASARKTRGLGFSHVDSAHGDVASLGRLVRRTLNPAQGPLLHVAGSVTAGDLAGDLARAGFALRREMLYQAEVVETLPTAAAQALAEGDVAYGLFFSPRTAATFVTLIKRAHLDVSDVTAVTLSAAVASQLMVLSWRGVLIARTPEQVALFAALDEDWARRNRPGTSL